MVWPMLNDAAIDRIAQCAATLVLNGPRGCVDGQLSNWAFRPISRVEGGDGLVAIEAQIEQEVAAGFQLGMDMLSRIFSNDPPDRRGFWRYYASNPKVRLTSR